MGVRNNNRGFWVEVMWSKAPVSSVEGLMNADEAGGERGGGALTK